MHNTKRKNSAVYTLLQQQYEYVDYWSDIDECWRPIKVGSKVVESHHDTLLDVSRRIDSLAIMGTIDPFWGVGYNWKAKRKREVSNYYWRLGLVRSQEMLPVQFIVLDALGKHVGPEALREVLRLHGRLPSRWAANFLKKYSTRGNGVGLTAGRVRTDVNSVKRLISSDLRDPESLLRKRSRYSKCPTYDYFDRKKGQVQGWKTQRKTQYR